MAAPERSLADLVATLARFRPEEFTHERMAEVMGEPTLRENSWRPRVGYREDKYARHSIFRTELFDMVLLCWKPGQVSPVHNHQGNLGWVRVLRGRMEETHWQAPEWVVAGVPMPDAAGEFDIDEEGVGHGIRLRKGDHFVHLAGPGVASVDRERPIHQLGNPRRHADDEPAISLHVYSRPHDSCIAFDTELATCRRVDLRFDTVATA